VGGHVVIGKPAAKVQSDDAAFEMWRIRWVDSIDACDQAENDAE